MLLFSFLASSSVFASSLLIQWLVYDDWLHHTGPLRIIGTLLATVLTFAFVLYWQHSVRKAQRDMVRRLETIARLNDRIRNALQAIECVTYLSQPHATDPVRQAVAEIDGVLREVFVDIRSDEPALRKSPVHPAQGLRKGKSA
jgi:hypothetical protein